MAFEEDNINKKLFSLKKELEKYKFQDTIGQGNFGKVKLAIYTPTNQQFAVKILNKVQIQKKNEMNLVQRELNIIKNFNHMNVIYVHQIIEDNDNYYIIMNYCENGELFDYIVYKTRLSEDEASVLFFQIINGVEYIHSKNIVHRDLKPENLLITTNHILKIIDFGLSIYFEENQLLSTKCGSPSYAAPEIITGNKYNGFKTDIWCCGIILYAMVCGYLPFDGMDNKELFKNIVDCKIEFPEFISSLVQETIMQMLNTNPEKRITIEEIKKLQFYLKGREMLNYQTKRKQKPQILKLLSNNFEINAFKNSIRLINTKVNSPHVEFISSKIKEILKTDTTLLYYNFKATEKNPHVIPRELKNLFFQKFSQKFPLKQILKKRLNNKKYDAFFTQQKTQTSKKPQITVESNIHPIIPKNKRMNSQTTLQRGLSTKMNTRCLPTEPKEFHECLKRDFTKYIKTNLKPQRNNNYIMTTTQTKMKISRYTRSKSNEDTLHINKKGYELPTLIN